MTLSPITDFIATDLHTNIWFWDRNTITPLCTVAEDREEGPDLFQLEPGLLQHLVDQSNDRFPVFTFVDNHTCFIHFGSPEGVYLLGPIVLLFTESSTDALHRYEEAALPAELLRSAPRVIPLRAVRCALLLFNAANDTALSENDCYHQNFRMEQISETVLRDTSAEMFSNRENQKKHTPYEQEQRILQCIQSGNTERLPKIWAEPVAGSLGTMAPDPVRNGKDLAIVNVTISSRAAIRGGLPAEDVFTLADMYVQQIEGLKNMMVLQPLIEDMQLNFARMVAEHKKASAPKGAERTLVNECKDYISLHLHEKLTVQEIAEVLGAHPNYLSSLFQKTEGVSMYRYILREKVDLTKNLLQYSDHTYLEIANYLGFSSQSHLGRVFKERTGMTLKQYRDRNRAPVSKTD